MSKSNIVQFKTKYQNALKLKLKLKKKTWDGKKVKTLQQT